MSGSDDFQQRRAGAVEVDARFAVEILVQRLAGILFEVGAGQADDLLVGLVALPDLQRQHRRRRPAGPSG
jgi:hypothetical protein